jgi:kynurenine formamidase
MTTTLKLCAALLLTSLTACHPPARISGHPAPQTIPLGKLLDLTHPFNADTIFWPTEKGFDFQPGNNGVTEKGYYYAANRFCTAEHGGTHIDAPIHFFADRHTVDEIELDRLVGEAAVIDVSEKCDADRDYQITVADLRSWEEQHSRQLIDVIVLLRTGYSRHWPDRKKYLGTTDRGPEAIAKLHFPGLSPDAARWLAEHRAPKAVGIDTASIDYGQSTHFESHVTLLEKNIPVFENVAHLDQLPSTGAHIIALPIKISGGSGGPLRIIAILPD